MRAVVCFCAVTWLCIETIATADVRPDFAMDSDPDMKLPVRARVFTKDFKPLWSDALKSREADFQRQAADSIAEAHHQGMAELEWARPLLLTILSAEGTNPSARFAAAKTLILLDSRDAAPALFEVSKRSSELRQLIEPTLASWQFPPIADDWRMRLENKETRHRDLLLAIRGVGVTGDELAITALLAIVEDPFRTAEARLAAARSAGQLRKSGLETQARQLAPSGAAPVLSRLCAVALLQQHEGQKAEQELLSLAQDAEPSVAAEALVRLNAINPDLVVPLAEKAMQNTDPKVRLQGVDAYLLRSSPERVAAMARLLDDPHPAVRGHVCDSLFQLAKSAELDGPIRKAATAVLAADGWRGQEQAALLLGALDDKAANARLVDLLESPRGEVMVAAAWALRKLAVPETLPALLDKAARQTNSRIKNGAPDGLDHQVGHLFEALGLMKHAPAESLMTEYIANKSLGEKSRGAAIWALGQLHVGSPDENLARAFSGRIIEPMEAKPTELDLVRNMSAVSIARMQATSQLPTMREALQTYGPGAASPPAVSARWVIKEMTGEAVLPPEPFKIVTDWFLEPLGNRVEGIR